jgi:O-antigen/teichoic acid export membrane protein
MFLHGMHMDKFKFTCTAPLFYKSHVKIFSSLCFVVSLTPIFMLVRYTYRAYDHSNPNSIMVLIPRENDIRSEINSW